MSIYLRLLGSESVTKNNSRITLPSKGYLLLAYLLLEGKTSRKHIAELFWLQTVNALNNLSKLCKAVNDALEQQVLVGDNKTLEIVGIDSDLKAWQAATGKEKWDLYKRELLFGFRLLEWESGKGAELQDWLEEKRRELAAAHIHNGFELAIAHLQHGEWKQALPYCQALATNDTEPQDRALRWWLLILGAFGQQEQARVEYKNWQLRFGRDFYMASPETKSAHELVQHSTAQACLEALKTEFGNPEVLPLVGRKDVLKRMEEAWHKGQAILLCGEPGAGKSRLALEFAKQKGSFWRFWGRPSDHFVPYSFHARSFAWIYSQYLNLQVPDWVRQEMTRIIPSLGDAPPPMQTAQETLRFVEAQTETFRLACQQLGFATMLIEDAQFADEASAQAGVYIHSKLLPYQKGFPRTIFTFRTGGFAPHIETTMREWVAQGIAVWIDLAPLQKTDVEECLRNLSPNLLRHSQQIMELTGGNAQLMLEVARYLLEHPSQAVQLSHPIRHEITQARLLRLPIKTLHVLRLAAVLDEYFSLQMAYSALGWKISEIEQHISVLKSAHLLRGFLLPHDLILEATIAGMTQTELAEYHGLALKALQKTQVPASLLLFHAIRAGDVAAQQSLQIKVNAEANALMLPITNQTVLETG
jgi:DNA polymerase III delta prime subunit